MPMILTRRHLLALSAAVLAAPPALANPAVTGRARAVRRLEGMAFGSVWRVTLPDDRRVADGLRQGIGDILAEIDAQMSPWRADSDVTRFNRAGAGGMAVAGPVADVARAALRMAELSGGAFDPTVGPVVARYGLGPIEGENAPGFAGLSAGEGEIRKTRAGLTFDPCGIAKGYALDRVANYLAAQGAQDFLIDLGGDLRGQGLHPSGAAWRVGVESPAGGLAARLALRDRAVASSGQYAQGFEIGGQLYSHIIDPEAGLPVTGGPVSVTVVSESGMDADAWATALMAAGAGAGDLARRAGVDALILTDAGPVMTGGMAAMVEG